jgi:hypothetical protein
MTATLTVMDSKTFDSQYGVRTLVTFIDEENNLLKWWTGYVKGTFVDVERGTNVGPCDFTPKQHGEYKGKPETTITRVSPAKEKARQSRPAIAAEDAARIDAFVASLASMSSPELAVAHVRKSIGAVQEAQAA